MSATGDNQSAIFLSATDYDLPDPLPMGLERYSGFHEMARGGNAILRSCHDRIAGRTIAIKTLQPQMRQNQRERRRFLREARITSQLQHPNTVPVYDIGQDKKEGPFFTMKRISGENFYEILKRIARRDEATAREFPVERRIEIVADACQALAYAHARGVIHRDVKPENIWVGNFGEVILLDWGAAKVWGQPDDAVTNPEDMSHGSGESDILQNLTQAGQRPGTPLYMSPEQISRQGQVDERSDVFSTGVVLYEMLTLSEPFRGRAIEQTFENIINYDPPPPSEKAPDRDIPTAIDAVVMKAISKKSTDRYHSMLTLIADLRDAGG